MAVSPIPAGYEAVTPYLVVRGAAQAIEFYQKALGATEMFRLPGDNGKIGHAELKVGAGVVMLADEMEGHPSPQTVGGCPISLMVYVPDVDAQFAKALAAGGVKQRPLADQFYGDRSGTFTDPFGYTWCLATHTEDVSAEEMDRRMKAMAGGSGS
jgi:PhnB protein